MLGSLAPYEIAFEICNYVLFRRQEGSKEEEAFNLTSFGQEVIDQAITSEPLISQCLGHGGGEYL